MTDLLAPRETRRIGRADATERAAIVFGRRFAEERVPSAAMPGPVAE